MFKYGLKLWSTNMNFIAEAKKLFDKGVYNYIELFVVPDSYDQYIERWKKLPLPYVIHAPHFREGMNLSRKEKEQNNLILMKETQLYADRLKANKIIVHPGIDGTIQETARQLKMINDSRLLVENKPYHALDDNLICNGTTPAEIKYVMTTSRVGFCLDIGHAVCSANAHQQEVKYFMYEFLCLKPAMFHLSDGDHNGVEDKHTHIGQGTYSFREILAALPEEALITVETVKDSKNNLNDYSDDVAKIKAYEHN